MDPAETAEPLGQTGKHSEEKLKKKEKEKESKEKRSTQAGEAKREETAEGTPWSDQRRWCSMASDEVSIMVHKDPPQKQLVFPEGLEPRDKQRTGKKKLFVLTITIVSLYPMVFREAKRKQK